MDGVAVTETLQERENGQNKEKLDPTYKGPNHTKDGKTREPFNYDDIMELHLGQTGKFQFTAFILLCLPALLPGPVLMSYTFTGAVPEYR